MSTGYCDTEYCAVLCTWYCDTEYQVWWYRVLGTAVLSTGYCNGYWVLQYWVPGTARQCAQLWPETAWLAVIDARGFLAFFLPRSHIFLHCIFFLSLLVSFFLLFFSFAFVSPSLLSSSVSFFLNFFDLQGWQSVYKNQLHIFCFFFCLSFFHSRYQ